MYLTMLEKSFSCFVKMTKKPSTYYCAIVNEKKTSFFKEPTFF